MPTLLTREAQCRAQLPCLCAHAVRHCNRLPEVVFSQLQISLLKVYFAANPERVGKAFALLGIKVERPFNCCECIRDSAFAKLRSCQRRKITSDAGAIPDLKQLIYAPTNKRLGRSTFGGPCRTLATSTICGSRDT